MRSTTRITAATSPHGRSTTPAAGRSSWWTWSLATNPLAGGTLQRHRARRDRVAGVHRLEPREDPAQVECERDANNAAIQLPDGKKCGDL